jgi:glyoxylase-like metal-dependent hydrolase (beta-lactamase superfamily II)
MRVWIGKGQMRPISDRSNHLQGDGKKLRVIFFLVWLLLSHWHADLLFGARSLRAAANRRGP